jgi:hypothetical protein
MTPPDASIRVLRRYVAIARCAACTWSAQMTGDDEDDVTYFLHSLLVEHVKRLHERKVERPS